MNFKAICLFAVIYCVCHVLCLEGDEISKSSGEGSRRTKRASLHEILKRNREMASVSEKPKDERKVVLVQEGQTKPHVLGNFKKARDIVTNYHNPFLESNAPSYADPDLLSAVMQQADDANYKFPANEFYKTFDSPAADMEASSSSIRRSIDVRPQEENVYISDEELDPYDLFPPAFHELLDIPLHQNNDRPLKKEEPESEYKALTITRGYANTNVHGQKYQPPTTSPTTTKRPRRKQPVRTRPQSPPNYKPAVRRTTKYTTTPRPTTTVYTPKTTTMRSRIYKNVHRERPNYFEIGEKNPDRIPLPPYRNYVTNKRQQRPRLRHRTTTSKPVSTTTTTTTTTTERPTTTTVQIQRLHPKTFRPPTVRSSPNKFEKIIKNKQKNYFETIPSHFETIVEPPAEFIENIKIEKLKYAFKEPEKPVRFPEEPRRRKPTQSASFNYPKPTTRRPPFKPSKIDPYASAPKIPVPTTYKPDFPFNDQFNVAPPSNSRPHFETYEEDVSYNEHRAPPPLSIEEQDYQRNWDSQTRSPFARHPTIDKHTFQKMNNFRRTPSVSSISSYFQRREDRPYSQQTTDHAYVDTFMQPPPRSIPIERFNTEHQQSYRKSSNSHSRKRPSILGSFGFFSKNRRPINRRSGISGSTKNHISTNDKKSSNEMGYVLTQGPLPNNAQRVHVIGPFRHPPFGAPMVRPHQAPVLGNSIYPTEPSNVLIPPSQFDQPEKSKVPEETNREPSFKVVNLPKENSGVETNEVVETFLPPQPLIQEYPFGFKQSFHSKRSPQTPHFLQIPAARRSFEVRNEFQEVSEQDKERLIAAKFHFPRVNSVRRSGQERHVIPVPVPLLTSAGNQVSRFHTIVLPPFPSQQNQYNPHQRRFVSNQNSLRLPSTYPVVRQQKNVQIKSKPVIVAKDSAPVVQNSVNLFDLNASIYPMPRSLPGLPEEEPQSFREPSISGVNYGGWTVVGKSKVTSDPVVSYVKENIPDLKLKPES